MAIIEVEAGGKKYLKDQFGNLVPAETVSVSVYLDDALADDIVSRAVELRDAYGRFCDYVKGRLIERKRSRLPAGVEVPDDELLRFADKIVSFDGKSKVEWVIDRKVKADVSKLSACKAAIKPIVDSLENPVARKALSEVLNLKSDKAFDVKKIEFLKNLNLEHQSWRACLDALSECFGDGGATAHPRCYQADEAGNLQLVPLRVSSSEV